MREERLRLADTYLALADVSCETGTSTFQFPQTYHQSGVDEQKTFHRQ